MVSITQKENVVTLTISLFLINTTNNKQLNLFVLANTIKQQLETVYAGVFGNVVLTANVTVKPLYTYHLKMLYNKLVMAISNKITHDNAAEADFCGLLIKLNPKQINAINLGENKRTIPHELGHILGLDHPHANGKFESINLHASELEKEISNDEKTHNLMCQSWYIQKAGTALNDALTLTESQVQLMLQNFLSEKLNKNYSLKKRWFNYRWVASF